MDPLRSLLPAYRRHRFAILFSSIALTIVGDPLLDAAGTDPIRFPVDGDTTVKTSEPDG